jgi:hypothetical protein
MKASARKRPPPHHDICVNRFPACRVPMKASGDELAPPKLAESPCPLPLCSRMAVIRMILVRIRRMSRNVNI